MSLTKQQQSARANAVVNHLERQMPTADPAVIDMLAFVKLQGRYTPLPWEYQWSEVLRWCREQRR